MLTFRRNLIAAAFAGLAAGLLLAAYGQAAANRSSSAVPGMVDIYTTLSYENAEAAGTGMVLTSTGRILTNNHVIRGANTIRVTDLDNGHTYKAKVVGYSFSNDVAVLQLVGAKNLTTASLGNSSAVKVGDAVKGIGNAGGKGGAVVATGKITALGRSITVNDDDGDTESLSHLIQTNAPIQPGDSGGPLVDSSGKVIGMDTAASASFYFQDTTQGYAIPIDGALSVVKQILAGHTTSTIHVGPTAFMGVGVEPQEGQYYGYGSVGLIVDNVVSGSPAAKIGLGYDDILTKVDGKSVTTRNQLTSLVASKAPGQTVLVRWVDGYGTAHSAKLTFASGPPQ